MTEAVIALPDLSGVQSMTDAVLLRVQASLAADRRLVEAREAVVAGEVARRSSRDLGYAGLAQRLGDRTPEKLVQRVTGVGGAAARALVAVGTATETAPWLAPVAHAVDDGSISVAAAAAIQRELGTPTDDVAADDLADAAARLATSAVGSTPEQAAIAARNARDAIDADSVTDREAHLFAQRSLRHGTNADGSGWARMVLDPESYAIFTAPLDAILSPRRGGPRFVDPDDQATAKVLVDDPRTNEQIALDALVDMIRAASRVDAVTGARAFGRKSPLVRVHTTLQALDDRTGAAWIEGQIVPSSFATAERTACDGGYLPVIFDGHGQPFDYGREQRTFTTRQRIALAARDGGCVVPDCPCPAAGAEAHHCDEWAKHRGRTDIRNGILLCRFHHMLIHNNGWRVTRTESYGYALVPPGTVDPQQRPIELVPKIPGYLAAAQRAPGRSNTTRQPPDATGRGPDVTQRVPDVTQRVPDVTGSARTAHASRQPVAVPDDEMPPRRRHRAVPARR